MEPAAKKRKYAGSYQPSWNELFKGTIRESKLGSQHAWCTVCCRDIKIAASGVYDVREHIKSKLHERQLHCGQVTNFFKPRPADSADSTTKAEVLFANFVAEHNLPALLAEHNLPALLAEHNLLALLAEHNLPALLAEHNLPALLAEHNLPALLAEHNLPALLADHFTDLARLMFPDSDIAKRFRCKRTKTTQIVKRCLAPAATTPVVERCRAGPFSLMVDESTDRKTDKRLVVLVR